MTTKGEMHGSLVRLQTTDQDLRALELAAGAKRRAGTTMAEVPIEALQRLVADHGELLAALRSRKLLTITAGPDQGSLL